MTRAGSIGPEKNVAIVLYETPQGISKTEKTTRQHMEEHRGAHGHTVTASAKSPPGDCLLEIAVVGTTISWGIDRANERAIDRVNSGIEDEGLWEISPPSRPSTAV